MEIVVQEGIEELVVIEELLEDPELTELEKCDALAPLYHVECVGLHICSLCSHQFYLAYERTWRGEGVGGRKVSLRRDFLHHQSHVTLIPIFSRSRRRAGDR